MGLSKHVHDGGREPLQLELVDVVREAGSLPQSRISLGLAGWGQPSAAGGAVESEGSLVLGRQPPSQQNTATIQHLMSMYE